MTPYDYFLRDIKLVMLYLIFAAIVPLGLMYLALETDKVAAVHYGFYIILGPAAIGIGCVYYFFHREKSTPGDEALQASLLARLQAGKILMTEKTEPLTSAEISGIKTLKRWNLLIAVLGLGVALWMIDGMSTAKLPEPQALYVTIGAGLSFLFVIYKLGKFFDRIIRKGEKTLVRGVITNKYNPGGVFGKYKIVVGNTSFSVWRWSYLASPIGYEVQLVVIKEYGNWVLERKTIPKDIDLYHIGT